MNICIFIYIKTVLICEAQQTISFPFSTISLFYSCGVRMGSAEEPEGSGVYCLYFWCALFSVGFAVFPAKKAIRHQEVAAKPRCPALLFLAARSPKQRDFSLSQKKSNYNRKIWSFCLEGGHSRSWEAGEGQCQFCVAKLCFLAGW